MLFLGGLTGLTSFRSMNVLGNDCLLKTKQSIHWLIHVFEGIRAKSQ